MEATAVVPEGRIAPEDAGLWTDSQIAPLKRIVNFAHAQGVKIGVQLAHAGRKASTYAPWVQSGSRHAARKEENGWPDDVVGPTSTPWNEHFPIPKELTKEQLVEVENAFVAAIKRAEQVGSWLQSISLKFMVHMVTLSLHSSLLFQTPARTNSAANLLRTVYASLSDSSPAADQLG